MNSVFHLVDLHREMSRAAVGLRGLVEERRHFLFRANELDIPSMVGHITDRLVPMGLARPTNVDVIGMAFHEALVNALEHGCLEMDSSLKGDLFANRTPSRPPCRNAWPIPATPTAGSKWRSTDARALPVTITDEAPGSNLQVSRFTEADLGKQCGRGLAMIQLVMDEVTHNDKGNQIRLVLNRKEAKCSIRPCQEPGGLVKR